MSDIESKGMHEKIAELQLEFKHSLNSKLDDIEKLWSVISLETDNKKSLLECHRKVHSLVGTSGTFGALALCNTARVIENIVNEVLDLNKIPVEAIQEFQVKIKELRDLAEKWNPKIANNTNTSSYNRNSKNSKIGNLIYFVEDDELIAKEVKLHLEKDRFEVKHFLTVESFTNAFMKKTPNAIIMDIVFGSGINSGIDAISKLILNNEKIPPLIFTSVRDDIEARLAAARLGAVRYLSKPYNSEQLSKLLDSFIERKVNEPYRVLCVDDDDELLRFYSSVLSLEGIEVQTLSKPLETLNKLKEFRADVIILDLHMPECSGIDLAKVIRQDEKRSTIPILYLSSEIDTAIQIKAINVGDGFLMKPIQPEHLVTAVEYKAKTSRINARIAADLEYFSKNKEIEYVTANYHTIMSSADIDGNIITVNKNFCDISGYSENELIGSNHRLLKSHYHPASFYKNLWETITDGKVWQGTICNYNKMGAEYWVESTIVPFLDEKGKPYRYVSSRTEVTKVIQSEARLKQSQDFANIGTWDWNIKTGDIFWSDRIWPMFGYEKNITDTTYENFMAAVHPDDKAALNKAITECLEKNIEYNIDHRVVWPDSSVHWVHERGAVIRDSENNPLHMLGVARDITKEKESSLKLQASKEKLSGYFEMSPLGFSLTDMKGQYIEFNESFRNITGYSVVELRNLDLWELTPQKYEEQEALQLTLLEQTGRYGPYEKEYIRKNGDHVAVRLNGMTIKDEFGVSQIWSIIEDINDSKEAEKVIVLAREEAENANRAKSQFLSNMSHELRTPMNAIIGFSQLLALNINKNLSDLDKENVSEISKAGAHLLELINEVLDLSAIEAGNISLSIEDVSLNDALISSLQLILPLAERNELTVKLIQNDVVFKVDDVSIAEIILQADFVRLKQVLINFLSNAVKYNSAKGSITIVIKNSAASDKVRVEIMDTGRGLSEEEMSQLFIPFNRLGAAAAGIEGTGIGLVITKDIVELMQGSVGVESTVGVGSTFWFEIPLSTMNETNPNKISVDDATSGLHFDHSNKTSVLYIEDNPSNLRLVAQLFSNVLDITLWSAVEGEAGLKVAQDKQPNIIILDINLPGMDGYKILEKLKSNPITRSIPVVAISANATQDNINSGLVAGFTDYLTKPIDLKELSQKVKCLLDIQA